MSGSRPPRPPGTGRRPFRFWTDGPDPAWLAERGPTAGAVPARWSQILAHVADTANESGLFAATSDAWLLRSGLSMGASLVLAESLVAAGGLELSHGRFYVSRWRQDHRPPDA